MRIENARYIARFCETHKKQPVCQPEMRLWRDGRGEGFTYVRAL
jgi:hypothetical protein